MHFFFLICCISSSHCLMHLFSLTNAFLFPSLMHFFLPFWCISSFQYDALFLPNVMHFFFPQSDAVFLPILMYPLEIRLLCSSSGRTEALQNSVCITHQMCHPTVLFYVLCYCHFWKILVLPMKGKLISTTPVNTFCDAAVAKSPVMKQQ